MQSALLKALKWHEALVTGAVESTEQLAKKEGVTGQYVSRLMRLAFLAPDIMDAICNGNIPSTLTLERLKKDCPLDWQVQRRRLVLAAVT